MFSEQSNFIIEKRVDKDNIKCCLCPHLCVLSLHQIGRCGTRQNIGDTISSINIPLFAVAAIEFLDKKPFKHFGVEEKCLSLGSYGCNLHCKYCENCEISQKKPSNLRGLYFAEIMSLLKQYECKNICFTYNEPILFYEFIRDFSNRANFEKEDVRIFIKTNAFAEKEVWRDLLKRVYAFNIDWKGDENNFKKITGSSVYVLKDRITEALSLRKNVEISIPLYYNNLEDMEVSLSSLGETLSSFNKDTPCHLAKVYPAHELINQSSTSDEMIEKAQEILKKYGISYVYIFNS